MRINTSCRGNVVDRGELEKLVKEAERQRGHNGKRPGELTVDLPVPWERCESVDKVLAPTFEHPAACGLKGPPADQRCAKSTALRRVAAGMCACNETRHFGMVWADAATRPMKRASCVLAAVLVQGAKVTNVGPEAAAAQAFRSLDKNRDGALTADELEAEIFASAHASVTCTYHACPEGFRMKPGAAEIVGNNDLDCCDKTCASQVQSCSRTGFRLRPDASQVLATVSAECCEKTCGGFECPNGWKARTNPDQIVQPSQEVCCLKTCELHVCNAEHDLTLRGAHPAYRFVGNVGKGYEKGGKQEMVKRLLVPETGPSCVIRVRCTRDLYRTPRPALVTLVWWQGTLSRCNHPLCQTPLLQ
eukprot:s1156_g18.t2